jgi:hypothetical protein
MSSATQSFAATADPNKLIDLEPAPSPRCELFEEHDRHGQVIARRHDRNRRRECERGL